MPGPVTLRRASDPDCELSFGWANDAATRAMSFNQALITYEEHVAWFGAMLSNPWRYLFIAEDPVGPIGLLRLSIHEELPELAEVGINLAPERRGQGLSSLVLELASVEAKRRGVRRLLARIRPENDASQRAFQRAGYELRGEEAVGTITALRYEIELRQNR